MEGLFELDRIGKLIAGKYRLELVLGRGGMGTVYRATHTWTGRAVAVKYLHPDHAQDTGSVGRFLREARAAASVRHPNAVDVLDMGQDTDGSAYLVLELLEGSTLAELLAAEKTLAPDVLARLIAPVLEALEELHRVGIIHRDFKPANIFLSRNPRGQVVPKLLDFGVAKVLDENASTATTTGIVVGTPAYMAPEQAAGNGEIGPWTDLWAVGAVLYQALVGELPFMAATPSLMLVAVMTKSAPLLASRRPDLDAALCAVVDRALTKDPEQRFKSAAEMAEALCKAVGLESTNQTGPIPQLPARPSAQPPVLPSSDTIQLSSDSMMVAAVSPDAPTEAARPANLGSGRSAPPPALPALAVERGDKDGGDKDGGDKDGRDRKEERKHWTGPNATGRLQAPKLGRARLALAAALAVLGGLGWWVAGGGPNASPSAGSSAADEAEGPHPESSVNPAPIKNEAPAAPPTSAAAAAAEHEEQALVPQSDAGSADESPGAAVGPSTERVDSGDARASAPRTRPAKTARSGKSARATSLAPSAPAPAQSSTTESKPAKESDSAAPPRVLREW